MKIRIPRLYICLFLVLALTQGCDAQPDPTEFSATALEEKLMSEDGQNITLSELLNEHKGKTILIDVWASWCRDCLVGFPKLKKLQQANTEVVFVYLSLDKTQEAWKKGIGNYDLKGHHYFLASGWDGPFGEFADLDWIPRYMVVDGTGKIKLFRAVKADDRALTEALHD